MSDTSTPPKDLIGFLDFYLVKKAPWQLPEVAKEWIVKYSPWITVVLLVLLAPLILVVFGLSAIAMPAALMTGGAGGLTLANIALIVQIVIMIMSIGPLMARKMSGWNLLFYADIFSLIYGILTSNIISAIVSAIISLYILFQIREKYS